MTTYTVRRLGRSAWATGIPTLEEARRELIYADRLEPDHVIVAENAAGDVLGLYDGRGQAITPATTEE